MPVRVRQLLLWLFAFAVTQAAFAEEPQRLALIVGNSAYRGGLTELPGAERDAKMVAEAARKARFVDLTGEPAQALLNVNGQAFRDRLTALGAALRAKPGALGLVYFAGHGLALDRRGDVHLLPTGAKIDSIASMEANGIRLAEVLDIADPGPQGMIIVVVDACRNLIPDEWVAAQSDMFASRGGKGWGAGGPVGATPVAAGRRSLRDRPTEERQNYFIAFSTAPDQVAYDSGEFSSILVNEMVRPRQNILEMFKRVADRVAVSAETAQSGAPVQMPTYEMGFYREAPCLISCGPPMDRTVFYDCANCPWMRMIDPGVAVVGSPPNETGRSADELIARQVKVRRAFAIGIYEVTAAEWRQCVRDGACQRTGDWRRENPTPLLPATHLSAQDAQAFIDWMSRRAGVAYRLATEIEWEYAARAGENGPFSFGPRLEPDMANYDTTDRYLGSATAPYRGYPESVTAYPANAFGLYNLHGNVWEWVTRCDADGRCGGTVLKGGSFMSRAKDLRAGGRFDVAADKRRSDAGLRVARDIQADFVP